MSKSPPSSKPWGWVDLCLPEITAPRPGCKCGADVPAGHFSLSATALIYGQPYSAMVHAVGCPWIGHQPNVLEAFIEGTPKPAKILLTTGDPWKPPAAPLRKRINRHAESPYRFVLQFFFQRPVSIDCWKRIRAPRGWRKSPTSQEHQKKFFGVRFTCRDLKYALTPDEVQELLAKLYLSLELVF